MIEIRCLKDIEKLKSSKKFPEELANLLVKDLETIKNCVDEDEEFTLENFNTDIFNNGFIAILDGTEDDKVIKDDLGLTNGLENEVPEAVENFNFNSEKWTRAIIVYNDSYGMILWLKNFDAFESYQVIEKEVINEKAPF